MGTRNLSQFGRTPEDVWRCLLPSRAPSTSQAEPVSSRSLPGQGGSHRGLAESQLSAALLACIAVLRVDEPHQPSEPLNRLLTHSARPSPRGIPTPEAQASHHPSPSPVQELWGPRITMTVTRKENCLGLREVKSLGQGHIASKWQSRGLNPALSASERAGSEV